MKYLRIFVAGLALTCIIVFLAVFVFNTLGLSYNSKAQEVVSSKYPFDLSDNTLKQVNFTVLAPEINTVFEEVRPLISADGKSLFFCRRNHPENVSKEKDKQDIWMSTLENNQWSKPKNLGINVNSKNADAICSVSPDGSEIIFVTDKINPLKPLMRSVRTKDGWTEPEYIEIENFYNYNAYIDFFYSFEANVLLLAIEREDSNGEQDLYVSLPKGKNKWSKPINLGSIVNSHKSDFAPFLSSDGLTLYFSSYGHKGLGGCDIFQTTRLDNSWKNWSEPVNLGEGINSPREESYFSISGDYKNIYFESYDLKNEVRDIFRADLPPASQPIILPSGTVVVVNKKSEPKAVSK